MSLYEKERSRWDPVREMMHTAENVKLGRHIGYWFTNSPRRALHSMSYYKFAARMIGKEKEVLDIGCGEGLGTWLLAKECGKAIGIDIDSGAIQIAQENWTDKAISFRCEDMFTMQPGSSYDAVVHFDVIEHIQENHAELFFEKITAHLKTYGIMIVGTPNLYSQQYASEISKKGHVNVYTPDRLENEMRNRFKHVFMFSANDELVHTGFAQLAHYLIAVCCHKK